MNKYRIRTAASLLLLLGSVAATAQYVGPSGPGKYATARTVAEVFANAVDDRPVELTGTLVRRTGRETYLFRDATGEIQVEIDRDEFPAGQPVGPDTRVILHGEVDTRLLRKPGIDVERVQIAPPAPAPTP